MRTWSTTVVNSYNDHPFRSNASNCIIERACFLNNGWGILPNLYGDQSIQSISRIRYRFCTIYCTKRQWYLIQPWMTSFVQWRKIITTSELMFCNHPWIIEQVLRLEHHTVGWTRIVFILIVQMFLLPIVLNNLFWILVEPSCQIIRWSANFKSISRMMHTWD
jgi:hypothetical protein